MDSMSCYVALSFLLFGLQTTRSAKAKEDVLVDPYAWDYDRTTKTNRGTDWIEPSGEVDCSSEHLKTTCAGCGFSSTGGSPPQDGPCAGPDDDIHLFRHVARSISQHLQWNSDTDSLLLTLSASNRKKLQQFVDGEDVEKVDIKDMLAYSWSVPSGPDSSEPYRIAGHTMSEVIYAVLILLLFASIFLMVMTFRVSLLRVILVLCFTTFIMSIFWSYMLLYQRKIAERMANDAVRAKYHEMCHSAEKESMFSSFKNIFRRNDACEKYFHDHQVHIALEVLPVEAVTHTFRAIMTSISESFGESLGGISGSFLGSLSVAMWLPATMFLIVTVVPILAVCLYCGGRQHQVVIREERPYRGIQASGRIEQLEVYDGYDARRGEDCGDRRHLRALPGGTDDARGVAYERHCRIEETPPPRSCAAERKDGDDIEYLERHLQDTGAVGRGHVARSRARDGTEHIDDRYLQEVGAARGHMEYQSDLRFRGDSSGAGHREWSRSDGTEEGRGRTEGQEKTTLRTSERGKTGDGVESEHTEGSIGGGTEGRVEEITPRDQPRPDTNDTGPNKPGSPEIEDPAVEEGSSEDDFEVIPEE